MLSRLIAPAWLLEEKPETPNTVEGDLTWEQILAHNHNGMNAFYFPNYPKDYKGGSVDGTDIDVFEWCFVDFDLKSGSYGSKLDFIDHLGTLSWKPTKIVDSGRGIHAYWRVLDLDAKGYIRLQRRLARHLNTDLATGKLCQLMRIPGTLNTKSWENMIPCETLFEGDDSYTMEQLDAVLPQLSMDDEIYAKSHYDKTHGEVATVTQINAVIPEKFKKLLRDSREVRDIWQTNTDDRSRSDYRLGHLLWSHGFTKSEAMTVLMNCQKAMSRAPKHREAYASDIISKVKEFEDTGKEIEELSMSVTDILINSAKEIKGVKIPCHPSFDNTVHGYRLGKVIGLVAGSGVGKTTVALNMFRWIVQNNPDYVHFFIPLEQPAHEIAERWVTMCGNETHLHSKVHVMSNYSADGSYRKLSLADIEEYLVAFQIRTKKKVGVVVIDHIGSLHKAGKDGENQNLIDICHAMKAFAIRTNTLLIMQSQAPREKAGKGDLELNKDAAYGTVFFEAYCDYLITLWQPVKQCYDNPGCPTVMAYKFCKIRHKKRGLDVIQEDVCYYLYFEPEKELLREMTQDEEIGFKVWEEKARKIRGKDRKTDQVVYTKISWNGDMNGNTENTENKQGSGTVTKLSQR